MDPAHFPPATCGWFIPSNFPIHLVIICMFLIHQSRLSNTASPCDHLWEKKKETKEEKERGAVEREREREREKEDTLKNKNI